MEVPTGHFIRPRLQALAAVLVAVHVVGLAYLGYVGSPVWHEPAQLAAGLSTWRFARFDMIRVNPPLVRTIAALPVAVLQPVLDPRVFDRQPWERDEFARTEAFVKANAVHLRRYVALARWTCAVFSVTGAYFCWRVAGELYGVQAGLTALALWCSCPLVLGNGATIMADVPAAGMAVGAIYCLWQWLKRPHVLEAILGGVVLGLAELCKLTLVILYPLMPVVWLVYRLPERRTMGRADWLRQAAMLGVVILVSLLVVNCGYLFDGTFTALGDFRFQATMFAGCDRLDRVPPDGGNRFAGTWLGRLAIPLPADYVKGIDAQRYDFERGQSSYLRGRWAEHGWWYYYLYALLIKMPLGTWLLAVLAVGMTVWEALHRCRVPSRCAHLPEGEGSKMPSPLAPLPEGEGAMKGTVPVSSDETCDSPQPPSPSVPLPKGEGRFSASWRDEMVVLAPFFTILIFVSSQTGFSVHSRYVIPALPFLFIWISKVGRALEPKKETVPICVQHPTGHSGKWGLSPFSAWLRNRRQPALAVLVLFPLAWSVASSLSIYPHSLSYFNELAAILPTPADSSYPKPEGDSPIFVGRKLGQSPGKSGQSPIMSLLSAVKWAISAGPRNGPRHLLDSNIDWGQDLFFLKDWLDSHPDVKLDGLAYYGSYPATLAGIPETRTPPTGPPEIRGPSHFRLPASKMLPGEVSAEDERAVDQHGPRPGWYALSVNYIYGFDRQYRYFLNFEPVAMAGYSIYIYHITLEEANRVRRKLGMAELKADGGKPKAEEEQGAADGHGSTRK